jgi:hypothetical protein
LGTLFDCKCICISYTCNCGGESKKSSINIKKNDCYEYLSSLRGEGFVSHLKILRNSRLAKGVLVTRPLIRPRPILRIIRNMTKQGNIGIFLPEEKLRLKKGVKSTFIYPQSTTMEDPISLDDEDTQPIENIFKISKRPKTKGWALLHTSSP